MRFLLDWALGERDRRPTRSRKTYTAATSGNVQVRRPVRDSNSAPAAVASEDESWPGRLSRFLLRYGLVLVVAWTGAMKFTDYDAHAIQPLVATSPVISWVYRLFSVTTAAKLLGILDLTTAALMAARPFSPRACIAGSAMASATFAVTASFMLSAPGWAAGLGGFPALSFDIGQAFIKDIVLLGAALWSMSEAQTAIHRENN